ncbi:adenosine deaminase [Lampetra fluviatilis]
MASKFVNEVSDFSKSRVELHIHLDGAIRPSTILEFAKKRGVKLPADTERELHGCLSYGEPSSLTKFLEYFALYMPAIAGDREAIRRVAYELVADKAGQGVVYLEARYSPQLLANADVTPVPWGQRSGDVTPDEVVSLVNQGFREGEKEFGITVRSILCCMRHMPDWSPEVLRLCLKYRDHGVVAIDLAGDESLVAEAGGPHRTAFLEAVRDGVHRTVHAGEVGSSKVVEEAVDVLRAERIGHGYHTLEDPELYARLLKANMHFEICPWSSYLTGACLSGEKEADFSKHPVVRFHKDKANFSINTDDPLIFDSTLATDYKILRKYGGFTDSDFMELNLNAARAGFLAEPDKKQLLQRLYKEYGMEQDTSL